MAAHTTKKLAAKATHTKTVDDYLAAAPSRSLPSHASEPTRRRPSGQRRAIWLTETNAHKVGRSHVVAVGYPGSVAKHAMSSSAAAPEVPAMRWDLRSTTCDSANRRLPRRRP